MIVSDDCWRLSFISRICAEVSEKNAVSEPETKAETHNNKANINAIAITDEGSNCPNEIMDKDVVIKSLRFSYYSGCPPWLLNRSQLLGIFAFVFFDSSAVSFNITFAEVGESITFIGDLRRT